MYCKLCRALIVYHMQWVTAAGHDGSCPTATGEVTGHLPAV